MLYTVLFCLGSLAVLLIPVIWIVKTQFKNRGIMLTGYVFVLVLISRMAVGFWGQEQLGNDLSPWESIFDSLVHTFQTFSMDEDYTLYTSTGKELLEGAGIHRGALVYGFIISILNVCAPILGGALLLEILADVFPYIKLYLHPFRSKFVFSELNDESITLAEQLAVACNGKELTELYSGREKPVLIFTDAYPDKSSEPRTELFERAKLISAICVKTDLLHIPFRSSKSLAYFLIDKKKQDNITAFRQLLTKGENDKWLWPVSDREKDPSTKIYIFTENDIENEMIWRACDEIGKDISKVLVRPIRDYMNTCINLMFDVPLFVPLLGKSKSDASDLYLTILGSGALAEEIFKSAFWCGQICGVQLHIDVLAENADTLQRSLSDNCTELFASCVFEQDESDSSDISLRNAVPFAHNTSDEMRRILMVDPTDSKSPLNPPYCVVHFRDVEDITSWSTWPSEILERTDYYVVALEDDAQTIDITEKINKQLVRRAGENNSCTDSAGHRVIAPAVFDEGMTSLIANDNPGEGEPYVIPFAHLTSRFSCNNVLMEIFVHTAEEDGKLYDAVAQSKHQADEYSYWANLSRAVHYPYKLFGLGIVDGFIPGQVGRDRFKIRSPYKVTAEEDEALAWSEHRRWNAFLRTQGFTCPTENQFDRYYRRQCEKGHPEVFKDVRLKFHPCLVERGMIRKEIPEDWPDNKPLPEGFDCLDRVSAAHHKNYKMYDYKEYDADLMLYLE